MKFSLNFANFATIFPFCGNFGQLRAQEISSYVLNRCFLFDCGGQNLLQNPYSLCWARKLFRNCFRDLSLCDATKGCGAEAFIKIARGRLYACPVDISGTIDGFCPPHEWSRFAKRQLKKHCLWECCSLLPILLKAFGLYPPCYPTRDDVGRRSQASFHEAGKLQHFHELVLWAKQQIRMVGRKARSQPWMAVKTSMGPGTK